MKPLLFPTLFLIVPMAFAETRNQWIPPRIPPLPAKPVLPAPVPRQAEYIPPKAVYEKDDSIKNKLTFRGRNVMPLHNGEIPIPGPTQSKEGFEKNRNYTFGRDGKLQIFNSFGNAGKFSKDTGTRTFYFLPAVKKPSVKINSVSGDLQVETASGHTFMFSKDTGMLKKMDGATIKEDPVISGTNKGGVEFENHFGIILDSGWGLGTTNYLSPGKKSTFKDQKGNTCEVSNSEVFNYPPKGSREEVAPKFQTRETLEPFLSKKCPKLDLTPLKGLQAVKSGADSHESGAGKKIPDARTAK